MKTEVFNVGPYILGQRLGLGGMGEVFVAARADGTGDPVALKLLLHHLSEQVNAVEMFLNEARLLARMAHPNVVRILDVGVADGRYYLAMELVQGVSLASLIMGLHAARMQLPNELVTHVARGLYAGLHHAHTMTDEHGLPLDIVHRDVSPQNVLVSITGEVKVTDFGIAQAQTSPHHTAPGRVRGKCEFLAPEQARGQLVDRRADLFAAASTLATLGTLRSPFFRGGVAESMRAVVVDDFPDLLGLRGDLDPRIAAALVHAAKKRPEDRFQTARDVCDALPPADARAAPMLGGLVRRLCGPALRATLDATKHIETQTGSKSSMVVVPDTVLSELPTGVKWHRLAPRLAVAMVAFVATLAVGAVVVVDPAQQEVAPPRVFVPPAEPELVELEPIPLAPEVTEPEPAREPEPIRASPKSSSRRVRPRPAAAGSGWLTVDAVPWAEVWLDGRKVGETPLANVQLAAGDVRVVLKSPATGNLSDRTVTIRRGRETFVKENLQ